MLLFTIIFFAFVIIVGISAIAGFSFYLKRRTERLQTENHRQFSPAPPENYRPLFAPSDEEMRLLEKEESAEQTNKRVDETRQSATKKIQAVRDFQLIWAEDPSRLNTVGLFRLASIAANADVFSETAESVIKFWREKRIAGLTANDLADLLDSHLGTLPQQERTAGAMFWLRREIMSLRAGSEEKF